MISAAAFSPRSFLPQVGVVCVWKADARGNMAPSVQYRRKNSAVTAAVFCGGPAHSADALAQVGDETSLSSSRSAVQIHGRIRPRSLALHRISDDCTQFGGQSFRIPTYATLLSQNCHSEVGANRSKVFLGLRHGDGRGALPPLLWFCIRCRWPASSTGYRFFSLVSKPNTCQVDVRPLCDHARW